MTRHRPDGHIEFGTSLPARILQVAVFGFAAGFVLFAQYPPLAVPALVALFFGAYIWLRVMIYMENNSFTPRRLQVSLTWALVGIDAATEEYDHRPVRVYFILLSLLFTSLVLRPIALWMTS